jgi:poly(A)-specific ribonuclease
MEVTGDGFFPLLPRILEDLSSAVFVAVDFEFSGVSRKAARPAGSKERTGKQTLQERYTETKRAAERYQILQMGITCVLQDELGAISRQKSCLVMKIVVG